MAAAIAAIVAIAVIAAVAVIAPVAIILGQSRIAQREKCRCQHNREPGRFRGSSHELLLEFEMGSHCNKNVSAI
jgi:hypothetical protein